MKTVRGNDLFVSGNASATHGLPSSISRWDGTNWHAVGWDIGVSDYGHYIGGLSFVGDRLYAAGHLDATVTWPVNSVIELGGNDWVDVGGGVTVVFPGVVPGYLWDMAVHGGQLYVAGEFDFAGGRPAMNIACWDGTNWSPLSELGIPVLYRIGFRNDELFVTSAWGVHKWSGSNWLTIGVAATIEPRVGDQRIDALTITPDNIYVGGRFDSIDGVGARNIARWDGTNWWPLGGGVAGQHWPTGYTRVSGICVWNNQVVITGSFDTAGGKPSTNFAVWHLPGAHINTTTNQIEVSWWKGFTNYVLEASDTLPASNWTLVATQPNTNYHSAPATGPKKFFRLRQE